MAGPDMSVVVDVVDFVNVVEAVLIVYLSYASFMVCYRGARMVVEAVWGIDDPYDGYTYDDYARDNKAAGLPVLLRDDYSERFSGEGFTDSSGNWVRDDPLAGVDDDIRRASK